MASFLPGDLEMRKCYVEQRRSAPQCIIWLCDFEASIAQLASRANPANSTGFTGISPDDETS